MKYTILFVLFLVNVFVINCQNYENLNDEFRTAEILFSKTNFQVNSVSSYGSSADGIFSDSTSNIQKGIFFQPRRLNLDTFDNLSSDYDFYNDYYNGIIREDIIDQCPGCNFEYTSNFIVDFTAEEASPFALQLILTSAFHDIDDDITNDAWHIFIDDEMCEFAVFNGNYVGLYSYDDAEAGPAIDFGMNDFMYDPKGVPIQFVDFSFRCEQNIGVGDHTAEIWFTRGFGDDDEDDDVSAQPCCEYEILPTVLMNFVNQINEEPSKHPSGECFIEHSYTYTDDDDDFFQTNNGLTKSISVDQDFSVTGYELVLDVNLENDIEDTITETAIDPSGNPFNFDGITYTNTITINEFPNYAVDEIRVSVDLNSDLFTEMEISVTSPQGTNIILFNENCRYESGDLVVTFADIYDDDDQCNASPGQIVRTFEPLHTFFGETVNGDWVLNVLDEFSSDGDSITFNSWTLTINGNAGTQNLLQEVFIDLISPSGTVANVWSPYCQDVDGDTFTITYPGNGFTVPYIGSASGSTTDTVSADDFIPFFTSSQNLFDVEIVSVRVEVDLNHTFATDEIDIIINSPSGTSVVLHKHDICDYGNYINDLDDIIFDSSSNEATICDGNINPTPGSVFNPYESLNDFVGESPLGSWNLEIIDYEYIDYAVVSEWELILELRDPNDYTPLGGDNAQNEMDSNFSDRGIARSELLCAELDDDQQIAPFGGPFSDAFEHEHTNGVWQVRFSKINIDGDNFDWVQVNGLELVFLEPRQMIVECPNDITVFNEISTCGARPHYNVKTLSQCPNFRTTFDNCAEMEFFPVGTTHCTVEIRDSFNAVDRCDFTVTVIDAEPPTITCNNNNNIESSYYEDQYLESYYISNVEADVEAVITVPDDFDIYSVEVDVQIEHTFIGDLEIFVTSPSGTEVHLYDNSCGSRDDLQLVFSDQGGDFDFGTHCYSIYEAPGSVLLQPIEPLGVFNGQNPQGDWTLRIDDTIGGDQGNLIGWELIFNRFNIPDGALASDNCGMPITRSVTLEFSDSGSIPFFPDLSEFSQISDVSVSFNDVSHTDFQATLFNPLDKFVSINKSDRERDADDDTLDCFDIELQGGEFHEYFNEVNIYYGPNDASTFTQNFNVADSGQIVAVEFDFNLSHSFVGDVILELTSPAGTTVTLFDGSCGNNNDLFHRFSDAGSDDVCSNVYVVSPVTPLSNLIGEDPQGTWNVNLVDTFPTLDFFAVVDYTLRLRTVPDISTYRNNLHISDSYHYGECSVGYVYESNRVGEVNYFSIDSNIINVPDSFAIDNVYVELDFNHAWVSEFQLDLVSPTGTRVDLLGGCNNSGLFVSTNVIFADSAPANCNSIPLHDKFFNLIQPQGSFSTLQGEDSQGDWTIEYYDSFSGENGFINFWKLNLVPQSFDIDVTSSPYSSLYTYNNNGFDVLDVINIDADGHVSEIEVEIDFQAYQYSYDFSSSYEMRLISPSNSEVTLLDDDCYFDLFNGPFTFSDVAINAPCSNNSPLQPTQSLSDLFNEPVRGEWKLVVDTDGDFDIYGGSELSGFSLRINTIEGHSNRKISDDSLSHLVQDSLSDLNGLWELRYESLLNFRTAVVSFTGYSNSINFEPRSSLDEFSCETCGYNSYHETAYDAAGNEASCVELVLTPDPIPPVARCKNARVSLYQSDSLGDSIEISPSLIDGGSTGGVCGLAGVFAEPSVFTKCNNIGKNKVTLTALNNCGESDTCQAVVLVERGPSDFVHGNNFFLNTYGNRFCR